MITGACPKPLRNVKIYVFHEFFNKQHIIQIRILKTNGKVNEHSRNNGTSFRLLRCIMGMNFKPVVCIATNCMAHLIVTITFLIQLMCGLCMKMINNALFGAFFDMRANASLDVFSTVYE